VLKPTQQKISVETIAHCSKSVIVYKVYVGINIVHVQCDCCADSLHNISFYSNLIAISLMICRSNLLHVANVAIAATLICRPWCKAAEIGSALS